MLIQEGVVYLIIPLKEFPKVKWTTKILCDNILLK